MDASALPFPSLTAIAAVASNRVIGDGTGLLWSIPEDFARFKQVTMSGVLVMGRTTYESLGGALRGRVSVVLSQDRSWRPRNTRGCEVYAVNSVIEAVAMLAARPQQRWWSAGGGQVYRALWGYTTDLDLTEVHAAPEADVTFPEVAADEWREISREPRAGFDFVSYTRRTGFAADALKALVAYAV